MSTNDRNTLRLPGEQAKDTAAAAARQAALLAYLRGLPSLAFSDKGRALVCRRFGVGADELTAAVAALQARPGRPTPALLRTIGAAVAGPNKAKGGARLC